MVKREKSPDVTEDIKLFAVWNPYPLNPNWVYDDDVQNCAKWVAEAIGNQYYLLNIHRKPSSRGMILLEISKEFSDHGRLLGEHPWCNLLKDITAEEKDHKTCVYYSIYRTCREASKDGWRPRSIKTKWLEGWYPGIGRFVSPYPKPIHCPLPPEDKTNKQICRHIPLELKALPTKANSPVTSIVVGSPAWFIQQNEEVPSTERTAGNWRKQDDMKSPTLNDAATPNPLPANIGETSALSDQYPEPSILIQPKSKAKVISVQQFRSQTGVPQKKAQAVAWVGRSQSTPSTSSTQIPQHPRPMPQNAWAKPLKIAPAKPAKMITKPDSADAWQTSHESWADMVEEEWTSSDGNTQAARPFSSTLQNSNMKTPMNTLDGTPPDTIFQHLDDQSDVEDDLNLMGDFTGDNSPTPASVEVMGMASSGGKDWSTEWSDAEEESKKNPVILCPTHGLACSKKICLDYTRLEKERKREEAKKSGLLRGRGRGRGGRQPWHLNK